MLMQNACLGGEIGLVQPPHIVPSHPFANQQPLARPMELPIRPGGAQTRPLPNLHLGRKSSTGNLSFGWQASTLNIPGVSTSPALSTVSVVDHQRQMHRCAGVSCMVLVASDFPHLRCRACRANNVPRRPDLETILTAAQLYARKKREGVQIRPIPPLPTRAAAVEPLPPAPTVESPLAVCKTEPDIDADLALQTLLRPSRDEDIAIDLDSVDLSYPEQALDLSYPEEIDLLYPNSPTLSQPFLPAMEDIKTSLSSLAAPNISRTPKAIPPLPCRKRRRLSLDSASFPELASSPSPWASAPLGNSFRPLPPLPTRPKPNQATSIPIPALPPPLPTRTKVNQHSPTTASAFQPAPKPSSSRTKPCSVPSCENVINTQSSASRCMDCIKKEWKAKRSEAERQPKKKVVTWVDSPKGGEEDDEFSSVRTFQDLSPTSETSSGTPDSENNGWESDSADVLQDTLDSSNSESESEGSESDSSEEEKPMPVRTGLKIRIPARPMVAKLESVEDQSMMEIRQPSLHPLSSPSSSPDGRDELIPSTPTLDDDDATSSPSSVPSTPSLTPTPLPTPTQDSQDAGIVEGSRRCNIPRCNQWLAPEYHWKSCVVCRASARGYQRKRRNLQGRHTHLDVEFEQLLASGKGKEREIIQKRSKPPKQQRLKIPMEPFDDDDPRPNPMEGAGVCSIKDCSHILPPPDEYFWKMCARCRQRGKENRLRSHGIEPRAVHYKFYRHEITGPKAFAMKHPDRHCLSYDCGMIINSESKFPYCRQCRLRDWKLKRRILRKEALREQEEAEQGTPSEGEEDEAPAKPLLIRIPALRNRFSQTPLFKPRPPTPYPEYKNLAALLENFRTLSRAFFDAQAIHFALQPPNSKPLLSIFIFDGEFSVVASNHDNRKERDQTVFTIQSEIQQAAKLQFAPKRWITALGQGVVTQFVCWREPPCVTIPHRGSGGPMQVKSYNKVMEGELEVANFADRSHPFIPGERTIVRLRLVG